MTKISIAFSFSIALAACAPRDPRCQIEMYDGGHVRQCTIGQPYSEYAYSPRSNRCSQVIGCECDEICESGLFETKEECERVCVEPWP